MTCKLSVLDQSLARSADQSATALQETLAMAGWCEALGYERFWVSEHHAFADGGGQRPGSAAGRPGRGDDSHPHRLGRHHAAPLQRLQGRRVLLPARQPVPRARRPGGGPRPGGGHVHRGGPGHRRATQVRPLPATGRATQRLPVAGQDQPRGQPQANLQHSPVDAGFQRGQRGARCAAWPALQPGAVHQSPGRPAPDQPVQATFPAQ